MSELLLCGLIFSLFRVLAAYSRQNMNYLKPTNLKKELIRIGIHSVPRSGSTWLGSIFDSHPLVTYKLQPLFSYAFKDRLTITSTNQDIDLFFKELVNSQDDFLDQRDGKQRGIIPEFKKEDPRAIVYKEVRYHHILNNLLDKDNKLKVIGIVRNPLSVIYSWWNAPKEFRADLGWSIKNEWRFAPSKNLGRPEEFNGYEKWKEVAILFRNLKLKYPDRFYLLRYSDLIRETELTVETLFKFMNLKMTSQTLHFIKQSSNKKVDDAYGVYRTNQTDNKWKGSLPQDIVNFIRKDVNLHDLSEFLK